MKKIVIVPGGFHPFHAGHMALYNAAREAFPSADVFVAATADTSTRPFPFAVKKFLAQQAGVPGNRFIEVKSPFRAKEITQMYDENDTQLIFVRSQKDAQKQPQAGGVKRDGSAAYLQPYKRTGLEPLAKQGYMLYLPTVQFGPGMTSATEIRAKWPDMTPEEKVNLVQTMYPSTGSKAAAAGKIVNMLDEIIGQGVAEGMAGAQASLMGAPAGGGASTLNPTPTPMANAADRPRKGVRMGVEFDEEMMGTRTVQGRTDTTDITTTTGGGVTTRTAQPITPFEPDPELVRQKDELSRKLRAQGLTGAQVLRDPAYRELSRRIRGIEETAQAAAPRVREATLINDPDAGVQIRPTGGMGTYDESTLVANLARKFASMVDMVRNRRYRSLYYVLYEAGVVENMTRALAELEAFQAQQGRRPIARGREIDTTDYLDER